MNLDDESPRVTVVIPAFNEERFIGACLDSVLQLDYPPRKIEILVIDNGSTDSTPRIATEKGATVHSRPGLSVAALRNEAVLLSDSEVVAFLDADCVASEEWMRSAVRSLRLDRCITGAPYLCPSSPHWIEHAWHSTEREGRYETTHINAGNLICFRQDFNEIGGFDKELVTGEDYEFAQRAAQRLLVIADTSIRVVHFGNPKSIQSFLRREVWHGLGALGSLRNDLRDKPFWGTLAFGIGIAGALIGLLVMVITGNGIPMMLSITIVFSVVLVSTLFRVLRRPPGAVASLRLAVLFFAFYFGRMIALGRILLGWRNYRRIK
jgi:glycosyltransferase involved in cell wall biosynthesis